jgi:hypothetical protein
MIQFVCDSCGNLKRGQDVWILGIAAEMVGIMSARQEVAISTSWDTDRAVTRLAVHFCSEQCKNDYMKKLFGTDDPQISAVDADTPSASKNAKKRTKKPAA